MNFDLLFETSWEVCNKVGGIHTVVSTKALNIAEELHDNYILIGPDIWREDTPNPEFIPDDSLFEAWKIKAAKDGIFVKTGRWNISGKPIVMLLDFTPFFSQQNEIFAKLWENFKLDSITGQWDYVEPTLFGYGAGKLIESFTLFYTDHQNIVAQFHEWMTGSGVLYLKSHAPWVATSFTTHATVLGRCIAGNNRPLYGKMSSYNPNQVSREFNVIAKQSLERISAAEADVFTTVSSLTANECSQFLEKEVDLITPNGFDDSFVPCAEIFDTERQAARKKLIEVAEAVLGYKLSSNCLLIANSGRYEYRNKGIDIFIDALGELNRDEDLDKECVAFALIPAYHRGARQDIVNYLYGSGEAPLSDRYLTHYLHYPESDPLLNEVKLKGLTNSKESKVKIIFVPSYLNGNDGIFNISYYQLLIGFDVTVFPSYYEPWGYTPLESLMFSIPTITTSLAGFGLWVRDHVDNLGRGVAVIERSDDNAAEVTTEICQVLKEFAFLNKKEVEAARAKAYDISRIALWDSFVYYYFDAYDKALASSLSRRNDSSRDFFHAIGTTDISTVHKTNCMPSWKNLYVQSDLPPILEPLAQLSKNLWWSWNEDAYNLFSSIDNELWEKVNHNPILLLEKSDYNRLYKLGENREFVDEVNRVYQRFINYMNRPDESDKPLVAYFSMEFGIHQSLKLYSGGLGILAGDYLKEASDSNKNIVGVGLLYRYGYFTQQLGTHGEQLALYDAVDFSRIPVSMLSDSDGNPLTVSLTWPGRTINVKLWQAAIGKVKLILLDTDFEENNAEDRCITHRLYGGDNEYRMRQEIILGIAGVRALAAMGIKPDIYHCNEGHAAFIGIERLSALINEYHLTYNEAIEVVRASTLFTTHTPVPAGHDIFEEDLMRKYLSHYCSRLSISWEQFMNLGYVEGEYNRGFNMSYLATRVSQEVNGVSEIHGEVSRKMFSKLWRGYLSEELFVGHVTNGVHFPSWTAPEWKNLYKELFGTDEFDQTDRSLWNKLQYVDDARISTIKKSLKKKLFDEIRIRLRNNMCDNRVNPRTIMNISAQLDENALTIGFARRFATYKRAGLLFKDLDRLSSIVNNPKHPVQFVYAGKAHPNDGGGQDIIRRIYEISQMPQFAGKVIFLEDYDIELSKFLVRGVDIWLNTPTRPLEASGTSGEKAVMNGTIHFSVIDGWWGEGYQPLAGWALQKERMFENQDLQDAVDSETIYNILENEIVPTYYDKNEYGVSSKWVRYIKNTMTMVAPDFTMRRQLDDYCSKYYDPMYARSKRINADEFRKAKELAEWKSFISSRWSDIEVLDYNFEKTDTNIYHSGTTYKANLALDVKDIHPEDVGVEFIVASRDNKEQYKLEYKREFELVKCKGNKCIFTLDFIPVTAGAFFYGVRLYPRNKELPHQQDFALVRWIE